MGRNSSGNGYSKAGSKAIAINSNGTILTSGATKQMLSSAESISKLPDREVVLQLQRGISRYEKVMGVRERDIKVATVRGAYGVTYLNQDGSQGIYLNKSIFSQKRNKLESDYKKQNYDTGFKNLTNRPIQHTITHELAHATWTSSYTSTKAKGAGKEIKELYKSWSRDKSKKGYGEYGKSNVDEFWAEVITKGIHGKSDKYTRKAISIAKKYKL